MTSHPPETDEIDPLKLWLCIGGCTLLLIVAMLIWLPRLLGPLALDSDYVKLSAVVHPPFQAYSEPIQIYICAPDRQHPEQTKFTAVFKAEDGGVNQVSWLEDKGLLDTADHGCRPVESEAGARRLHSDFLRIDLPSGEIRILKEKAGDAESQAKVDEILSRFTRIYSFLRGIRPEIQKSPVLARAY